MFNYCAFGLNISSEIELPGITQTEGNVEPDVKIVLDAVKLPVSLETSSNYCLDEGDVYLWWENIGKVSISSGKQIIVEVDGDLDSIIPFLLGPVMALLLHQRGFLVLHGSSVRMNGGAAAFLAYRGTGKSTTAIHLYKKGYPIVTDDILAISFDEDGVPFLNPGYLHVRLAEDSYEQVRDDTDILTPIRTIVGKVFCDASSRYSARPSRLERIYLMEKGDEIRISEIKSQETLLDLLRHSIAQRIFKETDQSDNLVHCANLINNVIFRRLEVNHSFEELSELVDLIEKDFHENKGIS